MRILLIVAALCFGAACTETERIATTPTPRATVSAAVVATAAPTTAAPTTAGRTATVTPLASSTSPAPTTARSSASPTSATTTATPLPTSARPSASSGPTLPVGASLPPMPDQPALPSGTTVLARATITFAIAPGETRKFEPADLATASGATPPPSATLSWTIAWRATESLAAAWYRQTDVSDLGRGRWGTASLAGAGFQLRNDGSATVFGELSYTIATR